MALFRDEPRSATIEVGRRTLKPVRTRVQSAWFQRLKLKYDKLLSSFGYN